MKSYFLALLCEANMRARRIEAAFHALNEALAYVEKSGERLWEPELYRLRSTLLLMQGGDKIEAERCFQKSIELARCHGSKTLELRAAVSLGSIWRSGGKKREARQLVQSLFDSFSEGFDTVDLKETKAFLGAHV